MSFPLTATYAKFVDAGLIEHLGQGGKRSDLPENIRQASKDLTKPQREKLMNSIDDQIKRINQSKGSELLNIPGYKGNEPKGFLQEILNAAKDASIDGAGSALDKISTKAEDPEGSGDNGTGNRGSNDNGMDTGGSGGNGTGGNGTDNGSSNDNGTGGNGTDNGSSNDNGTGGNGTDNGGNDNDTGRSEGSDFDLESEVGLGSWRGPGREMSASPMSEEDQGALEAILQQKFEEAITPLSRFITDGFSEAELEKINENISAELTGKFKWDDKATVAFQIPYKKIANMLGKECMKAAIKVSEDPHDEESCKLVGEGKLKMYHFCLDKGFQPVWFEQLFPSVPGAKFCRPRAIYAAANINATEYWPYYIQVDNGETVLFEKQKKFKNGIKSSFGVQVYDEKENKYKVVLKGKISGLEKWRMSNNAYKFFASERKYRKEDLGEVVWIYFYTTAPIKSADAMRNKSSAATEFCVKFQKSMMPKMITSSSLINFLGDDFDLNQIIQELSQRDKAELPWGNLAEKYSFNLKKLRTPGALGSRRNIDDLAAELSRMGIENPLNAPSALHSGGRNIGNHTEAMKAEENDAIAGLRREMDNKFEEVDNRVSNIEANMVTTEYMEKKFEKLMGALNKR